MSKDIENRILLSLRRRPNNLAGYVKVYEIYAGNPEIETTDASIQSGMAQATFYRIRRELLAAKLLGDDMFIRDIEVPMAIRTGQLPPVRYSVTHLAYYLTKFKDHEIVPPYDLTKEQIIEHYKRKMSQDPELGQDIVFGIQERLAYLAIFTGKLDPFKNMLGTVEPPKELS